MKLFTVLLTSLTIAAATITPVLADNKADSEACILAAKVYILQRATTPRFANSNWTSMQMAQICRISPNQGYEMFLLEVDLMQKEAELSSLNAPEPESDVVVPSDVAVPQEAYVPPAVRQMQELMRSK